MSTTTIRQTEDTVPPSEPVLDVTVIGPDAFVAICEWSENDNKRTLTTLQEVRVPYRELVRALNGAAWAHVERAEIESGQ